MHDKISLYTEPLSFRGVTLDKPSKTLLFVWLAETEVSNIILVRFLTLRLGFPPIKVVTAFQDRREYEFL
jgi:hypothetical protein